MTTVPLVLHALMKSRYRCGYRVISFTRLSKQKLVHINKKQIPILPCHLSSITWTIQCRTARPMLPLPSLGLILLYKCHLTLAAQGCDAVLCHIAPTFTPLNFEGLTLMKHPQPNFGLPMMSGRAARSFFALDGFIVDTTLTNSTATVMLASEPGYTVAEPFDH
ncbi:uncharacterized protein BYT42DRAFT_224476 [Radiomyces spectabilis]|uniref:uncharacterized protein n=1 Tax=Radiomyces spectabilis TaxID=64574 RepID=UPI00221EEFF9|nr:uncharacterized protein BYT42DRAFT_224476 [Radiomyces spectabilis]KAI8388161.1 hypothetical protein BYT42DRAFT_224476 [Radiomyces spectabilis]